MLGRLSAAVDGEAVYGYEVWRGEGEEQDSHLTSVRGTSLHWFDEAVTSDRVYRYRINLRATARAWRFAPFLNSTIDSARCASVAVATLPSWNPPRCTLSPT